MSGMPNIFFYFQSPHFDGLIPNWHHVECFFRKNRPKDCNEIEHFDQLRWDDQKSIKASIEGKSLFFCLNFKRPFKLYFVLKYEKVEL